MKDVNKVSITIVVMAIFLCQLLVGKKNDNLKKDIKDQIAEMDERYPDGIGKLRELFLNDNEIVESIDGVEIVSAVATKVTDKPVLTKDQPWELGPPRYISVIFDEEEKIYKMWYQCVTEYNPYGGTPGTQLATAYALSEDGLNWEKPKFNSMTYHGKPTNLVFIGVQTKSNIRAPYVQKDYSDPDPNRRYKLLFHLWDFRGRGLGIATSPDGVHWAAPHSYTVMQGGFDTHNVFFWDPQHGCYVAYVRRWQYGKRYIARATSPDCYHWSQDTAVEGPDELDGPYENLYTPGCFRLKHARNVYVMVTGVNDTKKNLVAPQLAMSRDGIHWSRFRKPFIPFGKKDSWDSGGAWPIAREIPAGEDMLCYYTGVREAHGKNPDAGVGVAKIKRDRYVGLYAGEKVGTVTTNLMRLTHHGGSRPERGILTLNAGATGGSVRIELIDETGKTIPGYSAEECLPMNCDGVDHIIRWKNQRSLYPVIGKPLRMRFYLENATIYGFQVLRYDPELPYSQGGSGPEEDVKEEGRK